MPRLSGRTHDNPVRTRLLPRVHYRRPERQVRMSGLQVLRPDTQPPPSLPEHHSILSVLYRTFSSKEPLTMQNRPLSLAIPKRIKRIKSSIVNLIIPIQIGIVMTITTPKITTGYDFPRLFSPSPKVTTRFHNTHVHFVPLLSPFSPAPIPTHAAIVFPLRPKNPSSLYITTFYDSSLYVSS